MRHLVILGFLIVGMLCAPEFTTSETEMKSSAKLDVEAAVCGSFREPLMFWLWQRAAGAPNPRAISSIKDVAPVEFRTRDGLSLRGYKLAAENPKAYLLVAQGNAMLADHLIADLQTFRAFGWDVYIYDYRGYGISQGKSRLAAIVDDYVELMAHLNALGYARRLLYGISMGGVILLDAAGSSELYTRLVVDSSPGRISNLGCPERYDPVTHLPKDGARMMLISGARDSVVPPAQMSELIRVARSRGARVLQDAEFAHPYQDSSATTHRRRQQQVASFLSQE